MGDLKTQAKDCGYWAFKKESLNLDKIIRNCKGL